VIAPMASIGRQARRETIEGGTADLPGRREDTLIVVRIVNYHFETWGAVTDHPMVVPTGIAGIQVGRDTIVARTADLQARREAMPIVGWIVDDLIETWGEVTERPMVVPMATADILVGRETIVVLIVDHLARHEDTVIVAHSVDHLTQIVAPIAELLVRSERELIAIAARLLAIVAGTAAGPIGAETIDAMTISGRNALTMATDGLRGSIANWPPTPDVLLQSIEAC